MTWYVFASVGEVPHHLGRPPAQAHRRGRPRDQRARRRSRAGLQLIWVSRSNSSRGRPSRRSAITLRWISLVPPAIVRARLPRKPADPRRAVALVDGAGRAEQRRPTSCTSLLVLDAEQLADAGLRARAGRRRARAAWCARPSTATAWASATRPPSSVGDERRRPSSAARSGQVEQGRHARARTTSPTPSTPARWRASCGRSSQPAVGRADEAVVGHEHVVEEHLVEHRHPGQLAQRPDVDAGRRHVDHEAGDAVVARRVGIGAGQADPPVGLVGHRRPHLLAVDRPAAVDRRGRRGW